MTCSYCGTHLPSGAMFCGECGRAVVGSGATPASAVVPEELPGPAPWTLQDLVVEDLVVPPQEHPVMREDFFADVQDAAGPEIPPAPSIPPPPVAPAPPPAPQPSAAQGAHVRQASDPVLCAQCGAPLGASDIFCGECGFVRVPGSAAQRDTVALDPFPWNQVPVTPEPEPEPEPEPVPAPPPAPSPLPAPEPPHTPQPPIAPVPVTPTSLDEDLEQTRIVAPGAGGARFILQFSTGESVSVTGSGLLGRNPVPEPGEYVDAFVTISDPGKSVSKTHLEFGQDGGSFWVSDRFSGNGTIIREPERPAKRCEPGKRYRIVRGTRVEIGEQFFIVS